MNHRNRRLAVLVLTALIVPQLAAAQQRRPDAPRAALLQNPVAALLQHADSLGLGLSPDQTARLLELRAGLDEATTSARAALEAVNGRAGGGRLRELRPQLERIRTENQAVLDQVRTDVLSDEQWDIAAAFLGSRRRPGRGAMARPGRR